MNIEKLINEYYDELKIFKKKKKENSKNGKKELSFLPDNWSNALTTFFLSSLFCLFIAFTVFTFTKEFWHSVITFSILLLIAIIVSIWDNTKTRRHQKINKQAKDNEERIICLIKILQKYNVPLSYENIDGLIQATNENKPNHSHSNLIRKFMHIITSGVAYYIPILVAIIFCDSIIGKLDIDFSIAIQFIFMITFYFISYLIIFSVGYCLYISEFDPHIRKMYYFHDTLANDLRQLNCFRTYYGLDKTEEEKTSSDNETPTAEEDVSKENPTQNININTEATVEKKKDKKKNPKQQEEKNKNKQYKKKK